MDAPATPVTRRLTVSSSPGLLLFEDLHEASTQARPSCPRVWFRACHQSPRCTLEFLLSSTYPPVPLKSPRARIGAGPRCAPAAGTDKWVGGVSPGPHPQRTSPPNLHSLTQHSSSMPGLCQVPWCLQHGSDLPLTSKNPWAGGQAGLETPQS